MQFLVVNVGGYIGSSTRSEIEFAKSLNKRNNLLYRFSKRKLMR